MCNAEEIHRQIDYLLFVQQLAQANNKEWKQALTLRTIGLLRWKPLDSITSKGPANQWLGARLQYLHC